MNAGARALGQGKSFTKTKFGLFSDSMSNFGNYLESSTAVKTPNSTNSNRHLSHLKEFVEVPTQKPSNRRDKDFFLDILSSTATKREAKSYISRYAPKTAKPERPIVQTAAPNRIGVNLGNLYIPIRSVDESPIFSQLPAQGTFSNKATEPLHAALVKIKAPEAIGEDILKGVGRTLSQLTQLGLGCLVVVDPVPQSATHKSYDIRTAAEQADSVVAAIAGYGGQGARRLDSVLESIPLREQMAASIKVHGGIRIISQKHILAPLKRGLIPVIAPIAFAADTVLRPVSADEIVLALTREFAGIRTNSIDGVDPVEIADSLTTLPEKVSLDRVIVLDPLGGIPSTDRSHGAHVFVNLEQEYELIREELLNSRKITPNKQSPNEKTEPTDNATSKIPSTKTSSNLVETKPAPPSTLPSLTPKNGSNVRAHLENLDLMRNALGLLPPSSSGLLTTPQEAANLRHTSFEPSQNPGVGTRRRRNPLIHNLLTDKPVFSSSLPSSASVPATFVKRGMPVSIIPDPRIHPWKPPNPSSPSLQLSDPRIDLARLIHLIEDSFDRTLDVRHYLSRIEGHIAGIIICGEYEGGALLTWEPPYPGSGPERMVPYLDKFAVLKRSQGAGGVADIVFKAMVRECFPEGVCWRSRRNNPVNKWYFERAKGTWKMPGSNWTMFWTTEGVEGGNDGSVVFRDYEAVCQNVVPSWADQKSVVD